MYLADGVTTSKPQFSYLTFTNLTLNNLCGRYNDIKYYTHIQHGEKRNACRVLIGKPEGKRPLRRPRRRWDSNIKMDLREIGCGVWNGFLWLRIGTSGGLL
jgi:hypothetical protein